MIELRPEAGVTVNAAPKILLVDQWVKFSDNFPQNLDFVGGKTMQVVKQQQVTYERSMIVKEACYVDLNLSNESNQEYMYPNANNHMYEMLIGLKPGNYFIMVYFPANYPIYRLDYSTMVPLVSSSTLKYLGAITPKDSPADNPIFKLYLVNKLQPIILRIVADDGVDYEQCTLTYLVNRCLIEEGTPPAGIKPKPILYLDEISALSLGPTGGV